MWYEVLFYGQFRDSNDGYTEIVRPHHAQPTHYRVLHLQLCPLLRPGRDTIIPVLPRLGIL